MTSVNDQINEIVKNVVTHKDQTDQLKVVLDSVCAVGMADTVPNLISFIRA
uniref:Uncharacterized protein n=1 Tax=Romanomermis culicivorax TaxID=13658 RepID=A0A915J6R2_ROMCU